MQIHVERTGAGAPLVFVHGLGASTRTWDACRDQLADRYEVIVVDLPGHGQSPEVDDPAEYTRDRALEHLDALFGEVGQPVVLIGHSLGGYFTLAYAATRPEVLRGAVVLNTGPGYRDPVKREDWNARSRRNWHRFGASEQASALNLQHDSVVMDRAAEISTPTLFLAGDADRPEYTGAGEYLQRKMPHCRLVVIPGGDHTMHESQAAVVAAEIDQFVRELQR
ncbi:MAG: alpha/beta fold hydrolase [Ilumatobacteraceae bacterium]